MKTSNYLRNVILLVIFLLTCNVSTKKIKIDENKPTATITCPSAILPKENRSDDRKTDGFHWNINDEESVKGSGCNEERLNSLSPKNPSPKSQLFVHVEEKKSSVQTQPQTGYPPTSSRSNVNSLFNCDLHSSLCTYYYPAKMFDEELSGIGEQYSRYIQEMEEKRLKGTLWEKGMPAVGFPTLTMANICLDSDGGKKYNFTRPSGNGGERKNVEKPTVASILQNDIGLKELEDDVKVRCMTERLSFIHVHKAGGTSLHKVFTNMSRSDSASIARHRFFDPKRTKMQSKNSDSKMRNIALDSLSHATTYPRAEEGFKSKQHVIFALIRDPTERFISSLKQVIVGRGSEKNPVRPILKKTCVNLATTSSEALSCIARYVQKHGFWIELHFTPQVLDLAFSTLYQDVPIAVFSFRHIKTVLGYFGADDVQERKGSDVRAEDVLASMTVDDYTEETMQIVCEIYKMDVVMQRRIGLEVPRCDPYIPRVSTAL